MTDTHKIIYNVKKTKIPFKKTFILLQAVFLCAFTLSGCSGYSQEEVDSISESYEDELLDLQSQLDKANAALDEATVQITSLQEQLTNLLDTAIAQSENKAEENANNKYNIGDTWENESVLVSYDDCGEYVSKTKYVQPADGNKYVYATFTFENVSSSDQNVGYWDFNCYADGYACDGTYSADDAGFIQTLASGRKIVGTVYFEVPKDATEIEFEYRPSFEKSEAIVFMYQ